MVSMFWSASWIAAGLLGGAPLEATVIEVDPTPISKSSPVAQTSQPNRLSAPITAKAQASAPVAAQSKTAVSAYQSLNTVSSKSVTPVSQTVASDCTSCGSKKVAPVSPSCDSCDKGCGPGWAGRAPVYKPSILGMARRLFGRKEVIEEVCDTCVGASMKELPPLDVVKMSHVEPAPSLPPVAVAVEEVQVSKPAPSTVTQVAAPTRELDHAADYSWVQGTLTFVHVNGGAWIVRYAGLDETDPHGGSVVLARDRRLNDFKEGDVVRVRGEILNPRSSKFLGGPLYRVHSISLAK